MNDPYEAGRLEVHAAIDVVVARSRRFYAVSETALVALSRLARPGKGTPRRRLVLTEKGREAPCLGYSDGVATARRSGVSFSAAALALEKAVNDYERAVEAASRKRKE